MKSQRKSTKPKWPKTIEGVEVPIYGGRIEFIKSREDWNAAITHLGQKVDEEAVNLGCSWHLTNEKGQSLYLLGVFDGECQTFVHECVHTAMSICRHVGINPYERGGEEALAYLLDWIFGAGHDYFEFDKPEVKEEKTDVDVSAAASIPADAPAGGVCAEGADQKQKPARRTRPFIGY